MVIAGNPDIQEMGKTPTHTCFEMLDLMMSGEELTDIFRQVRVPTLIMACEETHAKWPQHSKDGPPNSHRQAGNLPGNSGLHRPHRSSEVGGHLEGIRRRAGLTQGAAHD